MTRADFWSVCECWWHFLQCVVCVVFVFVFLTHKWIFGRLLHKLEQLRMALSLSPLESALGTNISTWGHLPVYLLHLSFRLMPGSFSHSYITSRWLLSQRILTQNTCTTEHTFVTFCCSPFLCIFDNNRYTPQTQVGFESTWLYLVAETTFRASTWPLSSSDSKHHRAKPTFLIYYSLSLLLCISFEAFI